MTRGATYAAFLFAALLAGQVSAQDGTEDDPVTEGLSLLEQGTKLLMQGIIQELGTAWDDLEATISDLGAYHPPEVLPNGDIIIRRKIPLQVEPPSELEL